MLVMTNCEIKARKIIADDIKEKAESVKEWKAYVTIVDSMVRVSFPFRETQPNISLEKSSAYRDAQKFKRLLQKSYPSSIYKENAIVNSNFKNGVEVSYNIPYKLIKDQEAKNNKVSPEKYEEQQQKEVHKIVYQDSKDYINDEGDVGFEITTTYQDGTIQISKLTRIQDLDELLKKEYKKQQEQYQYSADLTPEAQERIIDQLTGMLMDTVSYDLLNKKQPDIFYKEFINKDGKKLEFNFLSIRKSLLERAKQLYPQYKNNSLSPKEFSEFKNLTTILNINVFPKIQNDIVNRLKARGYKFKSGNKLEALQDDGNLQELYDQLSSIDNTDFEFAEDITGKSDQLSDYSALTTSNKEKMSSKLRTFLSSIENDQEALFTLKIGDKVYNKQYVNENIVIQAINEITIGANTYEEVVKALQDASVAIKGREFLAQVVEKLQLEKAKGSEIVNQFVDKFNQQKNDLTLTVFEKKPVVLNKFKKDNKWVIVPLRDNDGNTVFYYDYKVINANRNDIFTNLKNDTKQRFIEANELTEETVDKSIVVDAVEQYKNFKDFVKSDYKDGKFTNPEEAIIKLKSLFETLNFEFSDELYKEFIKKDSYKFNNINFNLDGKGKSVFNKSYGILNNIFGNLEEDTSIDKLFGNSGARKLFEVEAQTKEYFYNTSTLDGKGRNIWGYSMPSPMFRELHDITTDDNLSFIASDPTQSLYTSSSYILSQLNEGSTEDILQFKANLKYSLFNTLKQKGEEGKELGQMEPAEFIATQIILHIGNDIVTGKNTYWSNKFLTTPSDKSTMYLIQTPNMSIPVNSNGKPTISLNSDLVDRFYNYFLGEYRRAKDYQDSNEAKKAKIDGITTYEPLLFYNFPQLNLKNEENILWKKEGDSWVLRDLSEAVGSIDVETYVKTQLLEQLKKEVENVKEKLNTVGLVQNNTFINGFPDSYKKRVPNSVSLQNEIKSLNLAELGKNEFKKQMLDLVNESNANLTDYMIHDYALNYLFHNIEMHTLVLGDPAQYLKDEKSNFLNNPNIFNSNNINEIANYIDAIRDNLSKRMAGVQANRMEGNTNNESSNIVTLTDVPTDSKIIQEIIKFNPDQASKYEGIKSMDGQEIMTAEEDLKQKLIHGKISQEKYQMLYDKVQRQHEDMEKQGFVSDENKFTTEDGLNAQPIKPVVFGNVYDPELKIFKTTYYKDSAFGLYPQFTQGLELDKVRKALYNLSKKGIVVDRLVMKSAAKLGAINPVQGVFNQDLSINQDKLESITKENIDTVPRSKQGIQLEVPYDPYKKDITIASQQVKLIFNEILNVNWDNQKELVAKFLPELKNEKVTGKLLKNYHNNIYKQIVELSLKSILDEIGINLDLNEGTYKFENLEKLSKTLQNTAIELGYSKLALDGLTLTSDGKEFKLPISFNENGDRLEKLLLSILNKAILQKISGRSFVLASEMGFVLDKTWIKELKEKKPESKDITENVIEGEEAKKIIKQYQSSIVFTEGFDPEIGLLPSRRKDPNNPNSEILPAQVLISWKFLNNKNEKIDINEFITEKDGRKFLDTSKIDPEILRILGIRIPVQGHPSMASIEIVGFLPEFMGDIIIAPQDFVAMMGSDFDIDKLYGYMYNYHYNKNTKKLSKLKFDESKIQEIDEEEFLLDSEEDFTEAVDKLEKVKQKKEKYIKEQKKKMLQNKLIDIYHTIMLHPTVYDKSLQGITEGNLGELSNTLKKLQQKTDYNYYSPSSVTNKIDEYFENKAGKLGVGVFSVNSTFLTVIEGLGLELQKPTVEKDEEGKDVVVYVPDYFTIPVSADTKDNPEKFYVISGNIGVNKLISMFQSASVDNAKLKYLNWINVNKDTMGVAAILSSLANDAILGEDGQPLLNEDYIVYFLSQPIIKEYINKVNAQNAFSDYVDTDALVAELLEKYKEEASKAIDSNLDFSQSEKIAFKNKFIEDPSYTLTELQQFVENGEVYNTTKEYSYLIAQYQILNKFLKLKEQADVLRRLQYLVNADSKGLPSTLAEANYKSKRVSEFMNGSPIIKNVKKVFVNESGKEVNEKEITTEFTPFSEGPLTLQGHLENIADSVSVKIFSQHNNIIASGTRHVEHLSKIITLFSGKNTENYPHNLVNNITKSYIAFTQSTNNLQIQSPDKTFKQEMLDLLQDREDNTSLATDLENFKKTEQYKNSILLKPFLESLKTEVFEGYKFVKYQASQGLLNTDEQVVQALIQLQDLSGANGTYPLFEKLIKYTFLVKLQKSPVTIRQFVPVYMQEALGLLRQFREKNNFFNVVKSVSETGEVLELSLTVIGYESDIPVYSYVEQFFQHNPDELKSVGADDYKFLNFQNKPTDDATDTILIKGDVRSKYTAVYEGKEFDLPYVSIYNFDERRFNVFKKVPNSDGIYKKIPNLGRYNLDEYNADTKTTAVSILPSNEVKGITASQPTTPVVTPTQPSSSVKVIPLNESQRFTRESAEKDTDYMYLFTDNAGRTSGSGTIDPNSWYAKKYGADKKYASKTQAVARGLNNVYPITTMVDDKRTQWTDAQFDEYKKIIDDEIETIKQALKNYKGVKFGAEMPFGKGAISNMKDSAPKIWNYLNTKLAEIGIDNTGDTPVSTQPSTQSSTSVKPTIDLNREWRGDLESRPVYTKDGVNTMRTSDANTFENFGNPFSEAGYGGTIKVPSIGAAVIAYKEWLLGTNHKDVKPEQRTWILDQINQGKLDGTTLLYAGKSEARGQGMHPTALAEVVEQLRSTQPSTQPTVSTEVKPEVVNSQPNKVLTPVANNQKGKANNILAQYGVEDTQTDQEKIKTILDKISVDSNAPYFKELANLLKQLDAQFNFTEKLKVNFVENSDSFYNPNDNSINLNVSNTDAQGKPIPAFSERVQFEILHELIHAVLDERLGLDQAGTIVLNRIKRLTKSLESAGNLQKAIDLFDLKDDSGNKATVEYLLDKLAKLRTTTQDVDAIKYNSEAERSVLNPLINEREFIASVLGDNQTRMWMNEVQYDEAGSILSKILDTFKTFLNNLIRSFGFKIKDKSALQEAINIVFDTVNYEVKDTTETVEFLDFGTYYKFEVKNGVVVKGEFSQGNKANYNPLTKASKKYAELIQSSTAEKLTTEEIKLVEQVKNAATVSGKTLQGEQVEAFEKATTWLNKPANTERDENGLLTENAILDNMFFLSGPGGSGKTFITEIIVSDLSKKGKVKLAAAAPTHQAKNVLKENLPKDTDATTVQSLLGMLPNPINKSTFIGNTLESIENAYYEGKAPSIFDYDYLVIDEASMIDGSQKLVRKEYKKVWSDIKSTYVDQTFYENPDLGTYLKEVLKLKEKLTGKATKVFLMGDVVQVVPVGSKRFQISKLLTDILKRNENNALLNQIRRTNNEEVKRLSLLFRESFNTLFENNNAKANFIPNINSINANNGITLLNQKKDVVETFIRLYKENIASGNPIPNFTNIIWYNNSVNDKTVNQTKAIRQILFNNQEEINPNESLILKSNYTIKDFFGQGQHLDLGNDTKFIVTKVEDGVKDFTVGKGRKVRKISNIPVKNLIANVQVGSVILENVPISIVTPSYFKELGDKFQETNPSVEGQSMTKGELYNLIENVTSVEYGYIVNSHKIQGSKVLNPIVDVENILASPEDALHVNNMIYTAISRTVNSLYIFHPQLTPKEGKPISKLTGVSNPQVPVVKNSTEAKDLTLDYLSQRLNVQYAKRSNIYSDKTLTDQERKTKLLPVETTIARLQANLESLKNNFVLSEYFRLAQKELNDFKDLINNSSNITEEDYFQAIQIFGYFDKLYSALNTQVTNYNDPNQIGDKFIVPAELWDRVKDYNTEIKALKDNFIGLALDFYVGVYNNQTQRAIPIDEFLRSEQSSAYRTNILNILQSKQQISKSVGKIVTDMVRQANQRIADHTQEDLTAFKNFEKDFSFKDLIRIDEYLDPNGVERKESTLLSRNNINYYLKKAQIFKDAESIADKSAKSRFIKEELAKVSYDVDARFLFVNEYLEEMKEYYKDNTIDWIDPSSESFYMDKILDFHKEQFSDYGNEYAEYRTNSVMDQAKSKIQYYLDQKEAFIASLQIQNLSDQEKEDRLTDWISYNSPFLLLNERFGFSTTEGANVNKEWKTAPQEVNVKTYVTRAGVTITGRPTIDYTKRKAKDHIVNKARYKYEDGTVTGFYDSKYASMEQEMIERELKAFQFEQNGDTVSADKERKRKIQWDYLKFVEDRQKYYMDMLPYHVKKELKWYNLVDVKKDYAEQFSDSLSSIMSFKGDSFLNFLGTELMKLIKLSFGFMWDKVVRTVSEKHIKERKQYYDFVSGQIKLSYDPAGFNNVLNKLGTGDVRTTDVFNYFSYLRDAAIQFQERSQAEELIKIGQFLAQNAKILDKTTSKDLALTDTDIASLNWHINSKLYGAKREEIYKGTESNLWKSVTDKNWKLTQAERDEKKLLTQRIAYLNQVLATATDLKAINQINEQIRLAENQLSKIKREMNKYTRFGAYSSYVVLKRLSFGVAGRFLDSSATLMASFKQALDGRIYGLDSYFKSIRTITSLYAPNALASLTTAAGVVSLNPVIVAAGVAGRFGTGVVNQALNSRKKEIAKINQILYRVGALDYLNYKEDDNVTSFVNKSNLTEEALASLKTLSPFSTLSQVEIINKGIPALAVFYETKIKDLNGKERSLIDAFTVDDNLDLVWNTSEFGTQEAAGFNWYKGFNMQQVISKAYSAQRLTSGDYDVTTSRYGDSKLMVRAIMLLRRFMGEFLNSRFGDDVTDEDTGLTFMGSYKALLKSIPRLVPNYRTNETKEFQEARVAATKQILFDVGMLFSLKIIADILVETVRGDDEDKEDDPYWELLLTAIFNFSNTVDRLVTENFQFIDPNIIKGKASTGTISPILGDLMDVYHVGESLLKAYTEGDTMTHREMIAKNLAPKRKVLTRITVKNKKGEDVEKVIYYPEVVGGELTRGKYSKVYEPRSRLWYNTKKLVPFMNLYIKYEKQQKKLNEMKTKE
jgi:hypothetical protein